MQERDLFIDALQKDDLAEREAFLAVACQQNAALRQRVDDLLAAHERQESFILDSPPRGVADSPTSVIAARHPLGTQIGPYKLLQQIGEGGMGIVYLAEQRQPVERKVALKIIKPGMDSRACLSRFEAERQALALMDHPNIARVLDAGATESRLPYFVMELVKGIPITKYCDEGRLSLDERLELMIPVCQAIQHAHQKGIIHRDIKPTNVLITHYDGQPVPKVIDFGIAKATTQRLTERTLFTELGQFIGTLEYMSPEQAELNQLDIDTRSDVYSLGVLLYELLTGTTPFDKHTLQSAAFHEMLRIVREEEPPKPSTRLSKIDTLPSVAANRSEQPARLGSAVKGELDWIVMKALDKDRARRYETAESLGSDLRRYLDNDHVLACPPSSTYRFHKFTRRHRVGLLTAAMFITLLIAGAVISTWQAIRATRAEALARTNETRAIAEEQKAVAAHAAEAHLRKVAEEQTRLLTNNQQIIGMAFDEMLKVASDEREDTAERSRLLVSALEKLNTLSPQERVASYFRLSRLLFATKEDALALRAIEEGLALDPGHAGLHMCKGEIFFRERKFPAAQLAFTDAIDKHTWTDPTSRRWPYIHRGFTCCRLQKFPEALADFEASHEAAPVETLQILASGFQGHSTISATPHPRLRKGIVALIQKTPQADARAHRLNLLACFGEFKRARSELERMTLRTSNGHYYRAVLAAAEADPTVYRNVCTAMCAQFSHTAITNDAMYTAWSCALAPDASAEYSTLIALARRARGDNPTEGSLAMVLGAVMYRAGQYAEALEPLEAAAVKPGTLGLSTEYTSYFLAMTYHRLGRREDARRRLAMGNAVHGGYLSVPANWRKTVSLGLLRKEASALIGSARKKS